MKERLLASTLWIGLSLLASSLLLAQRLNAAPTCSSTTSAALPARLITLEPSLTETVCALGACDRWVAVDRFSNLPARIDTLPRVGSSAQPEVEAIVRLKPDIVFARRATQLVSRLRPFGIDAVSVNTRTYADIDRTIELLAAKLALAENGQRLERSVEQRHLCSFRADVSDILDRPGPRIIEDMRALATSLEWATRSRPTA